MHVARSPDALLRQILLEQGIGTQARSATGTSAPPNSPALSRRGSIDRDAYEHKGEATSSPLSSPRDRSPSPSLLSGPSHSLMSLRLSELGGSTGALGASTSDHGFGMHRSVSASSAHHSLALLRSKGPSAAEKPYGFSFVDKTAEKRDVALINTYMANVRDGGTKPVLDDKGQPIQHAPASHGGAKEGMIQFSVNGRTYSTHADSSQLFPVSGDGIVSGKGPAQMKAVLKARDLLDLPTFYALDMQERGEAAKPWKQTSGKIKDEVTKRYESYMA